MFTLFIFLQLSTAAETIWLGYTLPPYSSQHPQTLAELTYEIHENGTSSASVSSWTPPPTAASNDVQIGILQGGANSGYAKKGSAIFVSKDLVLDKRAVIKIQVDERTGKAWSVGVTKQAAARAENLPAAVVVTGSRAPRPVVNKPVVLSAEGKVQEPPPEKTLFQKYVTVYVPFGVEADEKQILVGTAWSHFRADVFRRRRTQVEQSGYDTDNHICACSIATSAMP